MKLYMAEHVEIDNYWIFGVYGTEEKAWRACIQYHINDKDYRLGVYSKEWYKEQGFKHYYSSNYKKLQVREIELDKPIN